MRVRFSKSSLKFLKKVNKKKEEKVRLMLKKLAIAAEEGLIPIKELKIKNLKENGKVTIGCEQMV